MKRRRERNKDLSDWQPRRFEVVCVLVITAVGGVYGLAKGEMPWRIGGKWDAGQWVTLTGIEALVSSLGMLTLAAACLLMLAPRFRYRSVVVMVLLLAGMLMALTAPAVG